ETPKKYDWERYGFAFSVDLAEVEPRIDLSRDRGLVLHGSSRSDGARRPASRLRCPRGYARQQGFCSHRSARLSCSCCGLAAWEYQPACVLEQRSSGPPELSDGSSGYRPSRRTPANGSWLACCYRSGMCAVERFDGARIRLYFRDIEGALSTASS